MGLAQGSISLRRFLALGPVPPEQELAEGLTEYQFRPFQDGLEEERAGWCDWRNPLILPADPHWAVVDRFTLFGLRIDTRRVPTSTLKAHTDLRIRDLMAEKDLAFIGKEAQISMRDEVLAELLPKVMPSTRVADVAWDMKAGLLWTTATSGGAQSTLQDLFMKAFGLELQPVGTILLADRLGVPGEALMALDPLDFELAEVG